MPVQPPEMGFVTTTPTSLTVRLVPPNDPAYEHSQIFVYEYATNDQVHVSGPITALEYTVPNLLPGRAYTVVAIGVSSIPPGFIEIVEANGPPIIANDPLINSVPSSRLVLATTNAIGTFGVVPKPMVEITDIVQESRRKVRIEYRLIDGENTQGELVSADFSFNGTFSDATAMPESDDARHEGRFNLDFLPEPFITDPHHTFIWDIRAIPRLEVHTYYVRLVGKSGALRSPPAIGEIEIRTGL